MWCDNFDMDALKVIPGAAEILDQVKDIKLLTHGHTTDGKINLPSRWNTYHGLTAFFSFDDGVDVDAFNAERKANQQWESRYVPDGYVGNQPLVRCSADEAIRNWWCHFYTMVLGGGVISPPQSQVQEHFQRLLWHVRGWKNDWDTPEKIEHSKQWATAVLRAVASNVLFYSELARNRRMVGVP